MNDGPQLLELVWKEMLSGIFSTLGRLAVLAGCRHSETGRYHHPGLTAHLEPDELDETLRSSHKLAWRNWMSGSLEQQHAESWGSPSSCLLEPGFNAPTGRWRSLRTYSSVFCHIRNSTSISLPLQAKRADQDLLKSWRRRFLASPMRH